MLKNYLKIAFRNLLREKGYAAINVGSLAIGLACCVLISLYVRDELSYDRFHENADRIYRLVVEQEGPMSKRTTQSPKGLGTALKEMYPEIVTATGINGFATSYVSHGERKFPAESFYFVDSAFFKVFSFPLLQGDPRTALDDANAIVITEAMATRFFLDEDPVGKILTIGRAAWTVTGVATNPPYNSHFKFNFLARPEAAFPQENSGIVWYSFGPRVYFLLQQAKDATALEAKFVSFLEAQEAPQAASMTLKLQALAGIHLGSHYEYEFEINGDLRYIYLFATLAFLILLVAIINFINLATARFAPRAREVGMRKVLGAQRGQLVRQFLGESMLVSLVASGLALALVHLALPFLNAFTGKAMHLRYLGSWDLLLFIILAIGVGIAAGSYPALFLARFRPVAVLKGVFRTSRGDIVLRRGLVAFQVFATVALVTGAAIILAQLRFLQETKFGFDKEQVLMISGWTGIGSHYDAFKTELLRDPGVVAVTTGYRPGDSSGGTWIVDEENEERWLLHRYGAGYNYFETLGITVTEGRGFSPDFPADTEDGVILSETAAARLGLERPVVGQRLKTYDRDRGRIVGVVEDFNVLSFHEPAAPVMITYTDGEGQDVLVKLHSGDVRGTVSRIRALYESILPGRPIIYSFLDEEVDALFRVEERFGKIFGFFSLTAIVIAFLGLFGLAAFTAERRTKEIGVRKVLGASVASIVGLLSMDFVKLTALASAAAMPLAYGVANWWLDDFAFRVEVGFGLFAAVGALALGMVVLAVSTQALKTARKNPVDTLRYE